MNHKMWELHASSLKNTKQKELDITKPQSEIPEISAARTVVRCSSYWSFSKKLPQTWNIFKYYFENPHKSLIREACWTRNCLCKKVFWMCISLLLYSMVLMAFVKATLLLFHHPAEAATKLSLVLWSS